MPAVGVQSGRLRVSNWIVHGLYIKKTIVPWLLTPFQHVVDPSCVRAVADDKSAVTPPSSFGKRTNRHPARLPQLGG
jgi:hypothetical protein